MHTWLKYLPAANKLAMSFTPIWVLICFGILSSAQLTAQQPIWIWSVDQAAGQVPEGSCYFRKTFFIQAPQMGQVHVFADDGYKLFVNGAFVGEGNSWEEATVHDISKNLHGGNNLVAIKVTNDEGATAGLAAKITIKTDSGQQHKIVTNASWKTNLRAGTFWQDTHYNDKHWDRAKTLGEVGTIGPWIASLESHKSKSSPAKSPSQPEDSLGDNPPLPRTTTNADVAKGVTKPKEKPERKSPRFFAAKGFRVERITSSRQTGSLIAMTFTEFGSILASVENGPLLRVYDTNENGIPDAVNTCCHQVTNCQGIVSINGNAIVVGDGPSGTGVYRLTDKDRNGIFESVSAILGFKSKMSEYGPHGLTLGPDVMLYLVAGNETEIVLPEGLPGPYRNAIDSDLLKPQCNDPNTKATTQHRHGGTIIRLDPEGKQVELFAGGMRNAYDLAFTRDGELLVYDSDEETDEGLPWYRPTRLLHVTPSADFGWRSGWAKWPDYYPDTLPGVLETGHGSPTGIVLYGHDQFPNKYQGALFTCDWTAGEIVALNVQQDGAQLVAESEVILRGKPLNVTDIDVGPQGSLYFCTGGRGTPGEIFRLVWQNGNDEIEKSASKSFQDIVRHSHVHTSWGRQLAAEKRSDMGDEWDEEIITLVRRQTASSRVRRRALQLMHLVGPSPTDNLLLELSQSPETNLRASATYFLGLVGNQQTNARLIELLQDPAALVRRRACEGLLQWDDVPSFQQLVPLLTSSDRFEQWAARRLLEQIETNTWSEEILSTENHQLFIQGSLALLIAHPSPELAATIVNRAEVLARDYVSDSDFVDMLRVLQLAMLQGPLSAESSTALAGWLATEYPAEDKRMNRELVRLLVALQKPEVITTGLEQLRSDLAATDKIHLATHLRFLERGWNVEQQAQLLEFLGEAIPWKGGTNLKSHLHNARVSFAKQLSDADKWELISQAVENPKATLAVMFSLPEQLPKKKATALINLDRRLVDEQNESFHQLRVAIIAVLARTKLPQAMDYLREIHDQQPDLRMAAAMGLAQQPEGTNWDYLIRSLPVLQGVAAEEVLRQLAKADQSSKSSATIQEVIKCGARCGPRAADAADQLLTKWIGSRPQATGDKRFLGIS